MNRKYRIAILAALALSVSNIAMGQDAASNWDSLTEQQREVLSPYAEQWATLPAERRQRLAEGARRFSEMNAEQRAAARTETGQ